MTCWGICAGPGTCGGSDKYSRYLFLVNKTKYFGLRLSYKVSEGPESYLRKTTRKMNIESFRQVFIGKTSNKQTDMCISSAPVRPKKTSIYLVVQGVGPQWRVRYRGSNGAVIHEPKLPHHQELSAGTFIVKQKLCK